MKVLQIGDLTCKVGGSADENWQLLDRCKKKHWFFHLTDFPSCYVVLECEKEPSREDKYRCAEVCVENSKQKRSKQVKVDATLCANVVKSDEVGECEYKNEKKVKVIVVREVKASPAGGGEASSEDLPGHPQARPRDPTRGGACSVVGEHMTVRKHASLGCALVSLQDVEERNRLLAISEVLVGCVKVKLQPQVDKATGEEVPNDIFATWGRQVERDTPLPEEDLLRALERLCMVNLAGTEESAAASGPVVESAVVPVFAK
ncbi:unnamed protein product [Polarella glacialis]|uniref:NFACT RNA-binding domain-containing protein n=1 Tax=Polarella glacialis TaxID=89957 RepID=A0A813FWC7_POLGL|nr:unnamed protein product [Polarella glacialis]